MSTLRSLGLLLVLAVLASPLSSQEKKGAEKKVPKIFYSVPLTARPGEKQKLVLRGKELAGVKEVKLVGSEDTKIKVLGGKSAAVPNNYPAERVGDSELEIELELPKGARQGEVKLMALGANGNSAAYELLLRDDLPAIAEKEPNDGFEQAQKITVPCAIEGTIKGEKDVDVFQFAGKKGDKLRIEVQAARFGSPVDAMLALYDGGRRVLDSASESGDKTDPVLAVTLPKDDTYYLTIIDASDLGGANFGYRLVVKYEK